MTRGNSVWRVGAAAVLLLLGISINAGAQQAARSGSPGSDAEGILQSIRNAAVTREGQDLLITQKDARVPIELAFSRCQAMGLAYEQDQWWVLPIGAPGDEIHANRALWILPRDANSSDRAWHLMLHGSGLTARVTDSGLAVTLQAQSATLSRAEARPHSDAFGHRFSFDMQGGPQLEDALAAFYWGTMLPSVVEKTMAAYFPYSSGYVLSTLDVRSYGGSYPAVDHEFQIRGRLAFGSKLDLDIVKRMIDLQFRLMDDDPERLDRDPTSVQPDGRREYHVRRDSEDRRQNAAMFPLTGNIEVIEEAWHEYEATKDTVWLRSNIANLEGSAAWVLSHTDPYGRVWSDVYYEDQVIKDGRVTQAQAFAAHAFDLLARMENLLGRRKEAAQFAAASKQMAHVLVAPLPMGYWDPGHERFIDWVDRNGKPHDHIHLLANELPVSFGYATADQASAVRRLIAENEQDFERFPSFVAADIAAYTRSEIGVGGPYDLCAAGRYWYWDAAYRASQKQNEILRDQLTKVAAEAAKSSYFMSERYDMDDVYYIDGRDAHGADMYYEYPNIFAAVLMADYLGLTIPANADLSVAPHLAEYGTIESDIPAYAVRYRYSKLGFELKNLAGTSRRYDVDLSALRPGSMRYRLTTGSGSSFVGPRSVLTLAEHQEARWIPEP